MSYALAILATRGLFSYNNCILLSRISMKRKIVMRPLPFIRSLHRQHWNRTLWPSVFTYLACSSELSLQRKIKSIQWKQKPPFWSYSYSKPASSLFRGFFMNVLKHCAKKVALWLKYSLTFTDPHFILNPFSFYYSSFLHYYVHYSDNHKSIQVILVCSALFTLDDTCWIIR